MSTPRSHSSTEEDRPVSKRSRNYKENVITDTNKDYQAKDADLVLVSSDDLKFRVHKWALVASSKFFRKLLPTINEENQAHIKLVDELLEDSTYLKQFLDLAYSNGTSDMTIQEEEFDEKLSFMDLLKKYDVTYPMAVIKSAILSQLSTGTLDCLEVFVIGSRLDSVDMCCTAIKHLNDTWWDGQMEADGSSSFFQRNVLDLAVAPLYWMKRIPDTYKWALLHASAIVSRENKENVWDSYYGHMAKMNPAQRGVTEKDYHCISNEDWCKVKVRIAEEFEIALVRSQNA